MWKRDINVDHQPVCDFPLILIYIPSASSPGLPHLCQSLLHTFTYYNSKLWCNIWWAGVFQLLIFQGFPPQFFCIYPSKQTCESGWQVLSPLQISIRILFVLQENEEHIIITVLSFSGQEYKLVIELPKCFISFGKISWFSLYAFHIYFIFNCLGGIWVFFCIVN